MVSILQEAKDRGFIFDETTQKTNTLPYVESDILIAPNEFVTAATFNTRLKHLHYNFLFLYKMCNFGDFEIPKKNVFSLSGNNFSLYETNFKRRISTENTFLDESKRGAVSYYIPKLGGFVLFYCTSKQILTTLVYNDSLRLISNSNSIDPLSGSIEFGNITDVKVSTKDNLYVVDNNYKNIYLYNVSQIISDEKIYRNLPFIKSAIGGPGPIQENNKFNNINNITVNENFVVVEDDINKCFKILDVNLNWLNTASLKIFFDRIGKFDSIAIDKDNKIFGIKNKQLFVFKINQNFNLSLVNSYSIKSYIDKDEKILNLEFSYQDPAVFYIITNKAVKKVWSTNPDKCIGEFIPGNNISWGSIFTYNDEEDSIILKTDGARGGFLLLGYRDFLNLSSLLTNIDLQIYSEEDFLIKKDEYTSNWSYQKSIKKLYYNLIALLREIKFRLLEDNDDISTIIDRFYNKTFLSYQANFNEPYDLNIGLNEMFQAEVVNRLLKEIYTLQNVLLLYAVNNKTTKVYFSPAPEKDRPESLVYTYYVDESLILSPSPARLAPFQDFVPLGGLSFTFGGAPYQGNESISVIDGIIN